MTGCKGNIYKLKKEERKSATYRRTYTHTHTHTHTILLPLLYTCGYKYQWLLQKDHVRFNAWSSKPKEVFGLS